MKIQIYVRGTSQKLMDDVNDFIKDLDDSKIVDIKFTESESTLSAMIIYKT